MEKRVAGKEGLLPQPSCSSPSACQTVLLLFPPPPPQEEPAEGLRSGSEADRNRGAWDFFCLPHFITRETT
jgi:hypothetical protein